MKMLHDELERIRLDIAKLKAEESLLVRMLGKMGDETVKRKSPRNRALGVKTAVLNLAFEVGEIGVTSQHMSDAIEKAIPDVAKDTVRSVLSRLKSDGALSYAGDRYYIKEFAPSEQRPKIMPLRPGG